MRFRLLGGQKKVPRQFFALFQAGKTSLQIYIEPAHGGRYENGACFYQPPFLSGKFTLKILTLQTYLVGGRCENAGKFLSSPNGRTLLTL